MKAESGDILPIDYKNRQGNTVFSLDFQPMQSYLVLLKDQDEEKSVHSEAIAEQHITYAKKWNIEKMDLNSLTLDQCRYRIDNGPIMRPVPVIKLQQILLDLQRACEVEMFFEFNIEMDLEKNKEFYVVIEDVTLYEIEVNGNKVPDKIEGYWKDKSFKKLNIKPWIKKGINEMKFTNTFQQPQKVYDILYGENVYETEINKLTYDVEIENIYLLGDFGVISKSPFKRVERKAMFTEGPFTIIDQPKNFYSGDFTTNGLLFFAGQLWISQNLIIKKENNKRIILELGKQYAPLVKIYINDYLVKDSMWAPFEADITDYVVDGENKIMFLIFSSNRNLFGPHHYQNGECYNVGPESFTGKWSWVERETEANATEIYDREKNYWTDKYCFVEFGFGE